MIKKFDSDFSSDMGVFLYFRIVIDKVKKLSTVMRVFLMVLCGI